MSPEPLPTARDGRWTRRRSPRGGWNGGYSPAPRGSSHSPPQKYRRGPPSPRFQRNTEFEPNRHDKFRPPSPPFGRPVHHAMGPPQPRTGMLPPPPSRPYGNFGDGSSPRHNSNSFPNPPLHSDRLAPDPHSRFEPRYPMRNNSPPLRHPYPRNKPYLHLSSPPIYRHGRSRERSMSPSQSTPSRTRSRSAERYRAFQRSRSTSRARSRSLSRSRSSKGSRSPHRIQHRSSPSRSVSRSPPYRQHHTNHHGWRRRRAERSPSPLGRSSARSRSTSRSRSDSRGRARFRPRASPRSRSPSSPVPEHWRRERHERRGNDPIDTRHFGDISNKDRLGVNIDQPERFQNDRGYSHRYMGTNGFYSDGHGPSRASRYASLADPPGGRSYNEPRMYPDRRNSLYRRSDSRDLDASGWKDRRGQSYSSGYRNRQRGRRDRRRKDRDRERGRDHERERKRDRERHNGEPLPQFDRRTVDDLFLHALRISLRYRRPPFNISVISDLLSDIASGWSVRRTEFSSFSQLCRAAEGRHWLKLGRKGESVVLLDSDLFPSVSKDIFGADGHLEAAARRQREEDIRDVRNAYESGRLETPGARVSVESVAADSSRTNREGSGIKEEAQMDTTIAGSRGHATEHAVKVKEDVNEDAHVDDDREAENVKFEDKVESRGEGGLSNESAASERREVMMAQNGHNDDSEFGTREGTEGDFNTSEDRPDQNQVDGESRQKDNLGWLDKSALTVDISDRSQEDE